MPTSASPPTSAKCWDTSHAENTRPRAGSTPVPVELRGYPQRNWQRNGLRCDGGRNRLVPHLPHLRQTAAALRKARPGDRLCHSRGVPRRRQRRCRQPGRLPQAASRGRRRPLFPGIHWRVRRRIPCRLHPHLLPRRPRLLREAVATYTTLTCRFIHRSGRIPSSRRFLRRRLCSSRIDSDRSTTP